MISHSQGVPGFACGRILASVAVASLPNFRWATSIVNLAPSFVFDSPECQINPRQGHARLFRYFMFEILLCVPCHDEQASAGKLLRECDLAVFRFQPEHSLSAQAD